MADTIRVTVWGEDIHEHKSDTVAAIYPDGMHACIAEGLQTEAGVTTRTATLQEAEHGLSQAVLDATDVLVWWGHCGHHLVDDAVVEAVQQRVLQGMGLIVLHSGHFSKIFRRLMGTSCALHWREAGEKERLWICQPGHPIVQGLDAPDGYIELEQTEMYGEPFGIPTPDEQIFISWFAGGEVFRSGCTWQRGNGKIFYFRPGHETYPIYYDERIRLILRNAVRWAAPTTAWTTVMDAPNRPVDRAPEALEERGPKLHKPGDAGFR